MSKIVGQLQYKAYGQGFDAPWKRWGEYSDTKADTKAFNEDYAYLKENNLVRYVKIDSDEFIK